MGAVSRPRGPLPARVYWVRRLLVLVTVVAVLGGGAAAVTDLAAGEEPGTAATVAAPERPTAALPTRAPASRAPVLRSSLPRGWQSAAPDQPLPEPQGTCTSADVVVTPEVVRSPHFGPVVVRLLLTTRVSEACAWEVSPDSVVLTITQGPLTVWSSQDCPATIPSREVVPRKEHAAVVRVRWDGRESRGTCSTANPFAKPGAYTATAVARGSVHPVDAAFRLTRTAPPKNA